MKILGYFFASLFSVGTASADVYQWYDGDGDGSTWLSNTVVEPYANLSQQTLWWADLPFANLHHANENLRIWLASMEEKTHTPI